MRHIQGRGGQSRSLTREQRLEETRVACRCRHCALHFLTELMLQKTARSQVKTAFSTEKILRCCSALAESHSELELLRDEPVTSLSAASAAP